MKEQEDCSNLKNSVGIAVFKKVFLPKEPVILPANWIAVIDSNHDKLKEQFLQNRTNCCNLRYESNGYI